LCVDFNLTEIIVDYSYHFAGNNHPSGVTGHVKTLIAKSWSNFSSKGDLNELGEPMFTK
jgi:hypothetical protein